MVICRTSWWSPRETLLCSIASYGLDLSSPEHGHSIREPERIVVLQVLQVVAVVVAQVALAVVALVALEAVLEEELGGPEVPAQVQLGVALGFALDLGYGHVVELWSQ